MRLYVNIYSVGQGYGGPEEGGWWFDTGVPVGSVPVELTEDEWEQARMRFALVHGYLRHNGTEVIIDDDKWDPDVWAEFLVNEVRARAEIIRDYWLERYPRTNKRTSVLGGEDHDVVIEDSFARAYPDERPRYE